VKKAKLEIRTQGSILDKPEEEIGWESFLAKHSPENIQTAWN
jgi:hypothetical protein